MKSQHRRIAPRLWDGSSRIPFGARFPESVKARLRAIADHENRSMNWLLEEIVLTHPGIRAPRYIEQHNAKVLQMRKRA